MTGVQTCALPILTLGAGCQNSPSVRETAPSDSASSSHSLALSTIKADIAAHSVTPFEFDLIIVKAAADDQKGQVGAARTLLRANLDKINAAVSDTKKKADELRALDLPASLLDADKLQVKECIKETADRLDLRAKVLPALRDYATTGDRRLWAGYLKTSNYISQLQQHSAANACNF